MAVKSYEKRCARLVQDVCKIGYNTALGLVRAHQARHPESMTLESRALAIVENDDAASPEPCPPKSS